jgi:hypothetical protein
MGKAVQYLVPPTVRGLRMLGRADSPGRSSRRSDGKKTKRRFVFRGSRQYRSQAGWPAWNPDKTTSGLVREATTCQYSAQIRSNCGCRIRPASSPEGSNGLPGLPNRERRRRRQMDQECLGAQRNGRLGPHYRRSAGQNSASSPAGSSDTPAATPGGNSRARSWERRGRLTSSCSPDQNQGPKPETGRTEHLCGV